MSTLSFCDNFHCNITYFIGARMGCGAKDASTFFGRCWKIILRAMAAFSIDV
jgi:hypothetical protein